MARKIKPPHERSMTIDEEANTLDYLERAVQFIKETERYKTAWKWVFISLHGAIYGYAVMACRDIIRRNCQKGSTIDTSLDNNGRLINFWVAYEACQDENIMSESKSRTPLRVTPEQDESVNSLVKDFRNNFMHFTPGLWGTEIHDFPQITIHVLDVIKFLAIESNKLINHKPNQVNRIRLAVEQAKKISNKLPII